MDGDRSVIRSLAVDADDVVMALEATRRGDRTVLRVTPPFSARMRARIHAVGSGPDDPTRGDRPASSEGHAGDRGGDRTSGIDPIVVPPADLVADPPPYPDPDDTADAIRADPDLEYTPERHRERYVAALEEWRSAVRDSIVDAVDIGEDGDAHEVTVKALG